MIRAYEGDDRTALQEAMEADLTVWGAEDLSRETLHFTDVTATDEPPIDRLMLACQSQSLFSTGRRAVVVFGAEKISAEDSLPLVAWLENPDGETGLFLVYGAKLNKATKLHKALTKVGEVKTFEAPKDYAMPKWACDRAPHFGFTLKLALAQQMVDQVGADTSRLNAEFGKLREYLSQELSQHKGRLELTPEILAQVLSDQSEGSAFHFQDAFGLGDTPRAIHLLRQLLSHGTKAIPLVAGISRRSRLLLKAVCLAERGAGQDEIIRALAIPPFFYTKMRYPEQMRSRSRAEWCRVVLRLTEIDFALKSGGLSDHRIHDFELTLLPLFPLQQRRSR
jgi:DNA polymerase-3 subunit delta